MTRYDQYTAEELKERQHLDIRGAGIHSMAESKHYMPKDYVDPVEKRKEQKQQLQDVQNVLFLPLNLLLAPLQVFSKQTGQSPPQIPLPHMLLPEIGNIPNFGGLPEIGQLPQIPFPLPPEIGNIPNFGGLPEPGKILGQLPSFNLGSKEDKVEKFEEEDEVEKFTNYEQSARQLEKF